MVFDVRDTISGAFGSVCLVYAGLPFDTLKLRLQTHAHYRGLRHCLTDMVRTEGPLSLWKGASMTDAGPRRARLRGRLTRVWLVVVVAVDLGMQGRPRRSPAR